MLRPHGGYRRLRSFQVAEIIDDATVAFCDRFIDQRSRTHDQMVQAARSGRQNIAEGTCASGTSSQTELRLVGVARASLEQLLLDYEDFLRQRRAAIWGKHDPRALAIRALGRGSPVTDRSDQPDLSDQSNQTYRSDHSNYARYRSLVEESPHETAANALICLIHQANYLLDRQLQQLERQFIQGGRYSEQLAAARRHERTGQQLFGSHSGTAQSPSVYSATASGANAPRCPKCGDAMVLRVAQSGRASGSSFWGCQQYPDCTGTKPLARDPP